MRRGAKRPKSTSHSVVLYKNLDEYFTKVVSVFSYQTIDAIAINATSLSCRADENGIVTIPLTIQTGKF